VAAGVQAGHADHGSGIPWVASAGEEQPLFKTFRDAVDYLYTECRNTRFREPSTEEFEYDHGAG
jgi:hypothetical protein